MSLKSNFQSTSAIIRGIGHMAASAIVSLFHRPTRVSFLAASREFSRVYLRKPHLPEIPTGSLIDDSATIRLTRCVRNEWQTTLVELAVIVGIARERKAANIFEIGTFDGRTTLALHLNTTDARIHTIDLPGGKPGSPGGNTPGYLFHDAVKDDRITQLQGNSLEFDFSPWFGSQDFVFIDAGHSYRNALADSQTALRLLEGREGVIVWHDYAVMPGVTQAVEEVMPHVQSEVDFGWVKGTSLAVMVTHVGKPLKLSSEYSGEGKVTTKQAKADSHTTSSVAD
ncbi:class I SAM-dependent methyltransferase [Pelagicoccus mobilis]|uniref:Class I SAM-dependent methyltransferase n=1 Tax=Pelagicoccus mobilis TaxID=415221 RepID=A0A934S144_9BACT|nr:class I SAM-dependent methyltransferase [Pelagicoccus mobilis]MBK1877947.1 class I SAM-dependent methyltransferase [Pelagicoccus mobilis]